VCYSHRNNFHAVLMRANSRLVVLVIRLLGVLIIGPGGEGARAQRIGTA
jgi:hypothetical protein